MKLIKDKYQIIKKFETLGFANTYLANSVDNDEKVIIKELVVNEVKDWKSFELFEREGKVLKNLNHEFIPNYIDAFHIDSENGSSFYLVQEYIDGKSLQERIDSGQRFKLDDVYNILNTVLEILMYIESLNPPVIHRDIKPSNIIIKDDGSIYLIDFGAIQNVGNTNNIGTTVVGTTGFMAPEQLMGKAITLSDLYSLGVTIINILSHKNPVDMPIKKMKIQYDEFINSNINSDFKYLLDKLIEPNSEERIQSPKEAIDMLNKIKKGQALISKPTENDLEVISKPLKKVGKDNISSKKLEIFSISLFVFALLLGVIGYLTFQSSESLEEDIPTPHEVTSQVARSVDDNSEKKINIKGNLKTCIKQNLIKENKSSIAELNSFECKSLNLSTSDIKDISKFKSLTRLNLSNNKITDISEIGKLKNLEYLSLNGNQIKDIKALKNLKNLKNIYIYTNKISNLNSLSNLQNLEYLAIFSNKLEDITALSSLSNLKQLHIGFNKVKDLTALKYLTKLKRLDAGYNKITNLNGLENLTELTNLNINNNNISDISKLSNLKKLKWLNISHNKISNISVLKNLTNINYLSINKNEITDISSIKYLIKLETLWAGQNKIKSLPNLENLKDIKRLSLWNNYISDLSPLKNINIKEELDVHGNNIKDFSPISHIKNIKK